MELYKQEDSLFSQRIQENSIKYQQSKLPQDLEQEVSQILGLRNTILDSFINHQQDQFFESVINMNHFFSNFKAYSLNIIKIIWNPQFGECLLDSLCALSSCNIDEAIPHENISNNVLLISNLLRDPEVQMFYFQSPLADEIFKILSISENYSIIKHSTHVLIKTIRFFYQKPFPFNEIFPILYKIYKLSATCERYVARCIKQFTIYLDLSSFILGKKICDLCYFIICEAKSQRSIKHIMISMQYFMRCDVTTNLDIIFNSKIISQFMIYAKYQEELILKACPCFLIPFLEFIHATVYYGDRSIRKIFKIVTITFFKDLYLTNKSNHQIQSLILKIFILRLSKLFCLDDKTQLIEINTITEIFEKFIETFEDLEFHSKNHIIDFTKALLCTNESGTFDILIKNIKIFFDQFSSFVFDSKEDEFINSYIDFLLKTFEIASKLDDFNRVIFLKNFRSKLYDQFVILINSNELEPDTLEKANVLLKQITDALNEMAQNNPDHYE